MYKKNLDEILRDLKKRREKGEKVRGGGGRKKQFFCEKVHCKGYTLAETAVPGWRGVEGSNITEMMLSLSPS